MKVLVSACLLGERCRYDGASKPAPDVIEFLAAHDVVPMCPEVMGGFSIPHPANEIQTTESTLRVLDVDGVDNTQKFMAGARAALELAQREGCTHAILKAKSPSCGVGRIYDGSFSGTLTQGDGVAAALLKQAGIVVATEHTFKEVFGLS